MPDSSTESKHFIAELDAAVDAHIGWAQRVLRCAVLRASPGEDVLAPLAHTLCRFGLWFTSNKSIFEDLDREKTIHVEKVHQDMHDAIRSICSDVLVGRKGQAEQLDIFEHTQSELFQLLADFKTQLLEKTMVNDALTGLPLRYGLEDEYVAMQKAAKRHATLFYIAMIDIDRFKVINDTYGHHAGDIALLQLTQTLMRIKRPDEPLFRIGGEEFLMMMQCPTPENAASAAERLVQAVRNSPVAIQQDVTLPMTITLGLARVGEEEDMDSAFERADKALYEGKNAGRDRFIIAE